MRLLAGIQKGSYGQYSLINHRQKRELKEIRKYFIVDQNPRKLTVLVRVPVIMYGNRLACKTFCIGLSSFKCQIDRDNKQIKISNLFAV